MLYLALARGAFRRAGAYRAAVVAGTITNAFFAALLCSVYQAIYAGREAVAGLTLGDAISYTWLTQALISLGGAWLISSEIALSIRTGDVVTDLMRPWSFFLSWLARTVGERLYNLLFRGLTTYLIGAALFGARIPAAGDLLALLPSLALSMLLSFALSFCVHLTAFWLIDSSGVVLVVNLLLTFFSGFLLPLAYFPPALQAVAAALPFQAITSLPTRIALGLLPPAELAGALLTQLGWCVALCALGLGMQAAALRKVVVQGG